jgi:hypothetical protein
VIVAITNLLVTGGSVTIELPTASTLTITVT